MNRVASAAESNVVPPTIAYPVLSNLDDCPDNWVSGSFEASGNSTSRPQKWPKWRYDLIMDSILSHIDCPIPIRFDSQAPNVFRTFFVYDSKSKLSDGFIFQASMENSSALPSLDPILGEAKNFELPNLWPQGPLAMYSIKYAARNWDGYDADPITTDTIAAAEKVLANLPDTFGAPDIAPGADGTIGLEWIFDKGPLRKLFIDIGPGNFLNIYWRRSTGESKTVPLKQISQNIKSDLKGLFAELSA